jgi:cytochrome c553
MKRFVGTLAVLGMVPTALAADAEAGRAKVQAVCAACHGATGISVSDAIPNLAGQRPGYIEAQLRALKDGSRKNAIMNAIASQLGADDMANVAAYFSQQTIATAGLRSEFLPNVAKTNVTFPDNYKSTFTQYHTINFPATKQVRYYFANPVALKAARAGSALPDGSVLFAEVWSAKLDADGKPTTGADGFFVRNELVGYTAMARDAGWGRDIPDMLRNENWNYAVYTAAKQPRAGINQAECLACHKPLDQASYTFTLDQLKTVAAR